jgi:hypothetical protein
LAAGIAVGLAVFVGEVVAIASLPPPVLIGIGGLLAVLLLFAGVFALDALARRAAQRFRERCPACGRWGAVVFLGKRLLRERHAITAKTRYDTYYRGPLRFPRGYVARQEQVRVLRKTFRLDYGCRFCPHRWSKMVDKDTEDFDVD